MKIPVVLPTVRVTVDAAGRLTVEVDGEPHGSHTAIERGDLSAVLDRITTALESPVRVDVREADGTTYADIATPPREVPVQATAPMRPEARTGAMGCGFAPGEEVAVAFVLTRQRATADGTAALGLPPALVASRREGLMLVGLSSHVVANIL